MWVCLFHPKTKYQGCVPGVNVISWFYHQTVNYWTHFKDEETDLEWLYKLPEVIKPINKKMLGFRHQFNSEVHVPSNILPENHSELFPPKISAKLPML